jgi:hypothetical protein
MAPISGATAVLVMAVVATLAAAANALAPAPAPATSDGHQLSDDPLFFPLLLHAYFLSRLFGGGTTMQLRCLRRRTQPDT